MTLLSTVQRAAVLVGMEPPLTVAGSADATARQFGEFARIDAEDLASQYDWGTLLRDASFVTVAGNDQPGALPADFGRMPFRDDDRGELYDGNWRRGMSGPASANQWRRLNDYNSGGWAVSWRINGGVLQIAPPEPDRTLAFRYITNALYRSALGVAQTTWAADTDTCLIPENLIALGVIWRWKQAKGFDYGEDMQTAQQQIERAAGSNGGGRRMLVIGRSRIRGDGCVLNGVLGGGGNNGDYIGEF